jgi:cellulose synthase/poly-beta-1,6-N-acetylglucosamine synthase-like glycosyltransferase
MIIWICIFFTSLLPLQYVILRGLIGLNWKTYLKPENTSLPDVSVLVAARNEERDLPRLLKSLSGLDYPAGKLEILLAEDQSGDHTADLIRAWVLESPQRKMVAVSQEQTKLFHPNGKANALAILTKQAKGEVFFFTDADCEVPSSWIRSGVACLDKEIGLLIGITQVKSQGQLDAMQELDWWNTLGIVKVVSDMGFPTTGLGNNMVISRAAYLACGGFEGLPFTLTEDLAISRAIGKAGFRQIHQVGPELLVRTKPESGWKDLLRQRKRWMNGVMSLSASWKILLGLQYLFFPAILFLLVLSPSVGVGIWSCKILVQSLFLKKIASKAEQKLRLFPLLLFDFYQILALSLTILYYFWPVQTQWKSRTYP